MRIRALITGKDASYLAEWLLNEGCEVHGIVRRVALEDVEHRLLRIRDLLKRSTSVLAVASGDEFRHETATSYV